MDGNFTPLHAHDHETERLAFETFVDLVHERLERFPGLHVYHYAPYEITALRRLMGRYGTREAELDDLLRRGVFVDLYKVVRNGVRASRPGYGLKELELFLDFRRQAEIQDGGTSIVVFEQWMQTRDPALLAQIDEYNREDCIATRLLRDWLLERRAEALARFGPFPLPEPVEPKPVPPEKEARAELRRTLLEAGEELAAQLLDYHDRERKPVWWAFFDRIELTPAELVEDADSIGRLEQVGEPEKVDRSLAYTLTFPAQEHKIGEGQSTIDPATRKSPGEILEVDREERRLVLKRGPSFEEVRAARGGRSGPAVRHEGSGGRARAPRQVAARRRRPLSRARVDPPPRAVRPAGADGGARRDEGARALARPAPPRHPGAARIGEDVDVRAADRAPARARGSASAWPRRATRRSTTCSTRSRRRRSSRACPSRG